MNVHQPFTDWQIGDLSEAERQFYDLMTRERSIRDGPSIRVATGLPTKNIMYALAALKMRGLVKAFAGGLEWRPVTFMRFDVYAAAQRRRQQAPAALPLRPNPKQLPHSTRTGQ